jgi:hypothetical protein
LFVNSPKLFADFHALRRLLMPRHPPYALSNLTTEILNSLKLSPQQRKRNREKLGVLDYRISASLAPLF